MGQYRPLAPGGPQAPGRPRPYLSRMPDPTRYRIPTGRQTAEQVISRSRFVCSLAHAGTAEAAQAFIREIREQWPDSRHHATAWVAGPPGSTAHVGLSDDGEPHGTAGRPMLNVLLHSDVGEIVAVVTRWFGGVKLGTGGLARAYAGTVELALQDLPTTIRMETVLLDLAFGYPRIDVIQRLLPQFEATTVAEEYLDVVRARVRVPVSARDALCVAIQDATHGEASVVALDEGPAD